VLVKTDAVSGNVVYLPHGSHTADHTLTVVRLATFLVDILGTALGLVFVDPNIRSLFDAFIKAIGLLMGVLGGVPPSGGEKIEPGRLKPVRQRCRNHQFDSITRRRQRSMHTYPAGRMPFGHPCIPNLIEQ